MKLIHLISRVFWPGLFKIFWPTGCLQKSTSKICLHFFCFWIFWSDYFKSMQLKSLNDNFLSFEHYNLTNFSWVFFWYAFFPFKKNKVFPYFNLQIDLNFFCVFWSKSIIKARIKCSPCPLFHFHFLWKLQIPLKIYRILKEQHPI